jgi:hypothetical protein
MSGLATLESMLPAPTYQYGPPGGDTGGQRRWLVTGAGAAGGGPCRGNGCGRKYVTFSMMTLEHGI